MTRRRAEDVGLRKAWSPAEVAGLVGLPYETVLDLIHAGELTAFKVGRYHVIHNHEVDRWLNERLSAAREARSA